MTSSANLLGKCAGRGNDLPKSMRPARERLDRTGHRRKAGNGGCVCGGWFKSSVVGVMSGTL